MSREMCAMVAAARGGDADAFEGLVNRYRKPVCSLVYALTDDYHMAQDVAQDAFLVAHRRVCTIRDPGSFPTWLFRIAHRHAVNRLRDRERRFRLLGRAVRSRYSSREIRESCAIFEPGQVGKGQHEEAVREALATLKTEWATPLALRYYEGHSCREIGEILGIDERNVRVRLHRGREAMRRQLVNMASGRGVDEDEVRGRRTSSG